MVKELDAEVLRLQCESLKAVLVKLLDTREAEAKAFLKYKNAYENFSCSAKEQKAHERAMSAAISAKREALLLLATLKQPSSSE